ncbi:unnamed protein product [Cuscuta epithymum]|uniref:Uncharacterized protein n=1 Tax=Cuscuta epithymum TaxID=186058 RepID=A0AAV0DI71_9ASTE|nr:unnamed protein product [Cuscuta epithymum]
MSSGGSTSRGGGNAIRGRRNNGGRSASERFSTADQIVQTNENGSPNTPPSDVRPSFTSNPRTEASIQTNFTPEMVRQTQPETGRELGSGQRDYIIIGDLKLNDKVKKSLEVIASDLFTGWPAIYGNLKPQDREKYISRFSLDYTWAPSDNGKMISKLHSEFSWLYSARLSNIRKAAKKNIPDFAENKDYTRLIPFRAERVTSHVWTKL